MIYSFGTIFNRGKHYEVNKTKSKTKVSIDIMHSPNSKDRGLLWFMVFGV